MSVLLLIAQGYWVLNSVLRPVRVLKKYLIEGENNFSTCENLEGWSSALIDLYSVMEDRLEAEREWISVRDELSLKAFELQQSNRYKSEFLANISHELRTPLNSMLILTKLFTQNEQGNLNPEQLEAASVIHSAGTELLNLINDILDLSKIESGKMEVVLEDIDANSLFESLEAQFQPVAKERGISLVFEMDENVPKIFVSDPQKLGQILKNLLSNALKFTHVGQVSLTVSCLEPSVDDSWLDPVSQSRIEFAVKDTGIGISKESKLSIFEAFQQGDGSASRKYGGTGLGLSICKDLTELLGGNLSLESRLGKGSTFCFSIPNNISEKGNAFFEEFEDVYLTRADGTKLVDDREQLIPGDEPILVIEDDYISALVLVNLIRRRGHKCVVAGDGASGLYLARRYLPIAVILDLGLPDIDGHQVLDDLKQDPDTSGIPVCVVSCWDTKRITAAKGAFAHLVKPAGREDLEELISRIEQLASFQLKFVGDQDSLPKNDDYQVHSEVSAMAHAVGKHKKSVSGKILLVDDDVRNTFAISRALKPVGLDVIIADNGALALEKLSEEEGIDLIFMDMMMPVMDGYEAMRKIRSIQKFKQLPIVALTAKAMSGDAERCIEAGASEYLPKPVDSNSLVETIRKWLPGTEISVPQ